MNDIGPGKLVALWLLLMLSAPGGIVWLWPDVTSGHAAAVFVKVSVLLALVSAIAVVFVYVLIRSWSGPLARVEDFVAALPNATAELPHDGSPEIERLSRAMSSMAERVRALVERAGMEASRREAILACMAEGVLAVDEQLRIVFCNDAFALAFSTRMPAESGRGLYEIVREPALRDVLEEVLRSGNARTDRFQLPTAAGRWFESRALPLGESSRRGAVIVLHDITDLERQEQLRKDFVADVSHELRTPLTAIRGYAETLLDGALEDKENSRKFVETILAHTVRLTNIASDLLVLSELDADGAADSRHEEIPLAGVVESALHSVERNAARTGVRIESSIPPDATVLGHRFRLEQALVNLLDNAIKFNRANGEVQVTAENKNGTVRISVRDTGPGIASSEVRRIFERFYRVDRARARPVGGTGLGLAIVKQAVEQMGGSVSVESQLGSGSTFSLVLPSGASSV